MPEAFMDLLLTILAAGGGGAVVAYLVFKSLGTAWLEGKFAEKLESFRHEKAKELERFRAEIDGSLKSQDRFDERHLEGVLEIWDALKFAQQKTLATVSPIQQYANLRGMTDETLDDLLSEFSLKAWQIDSVKNASDRQEEFTRIINLKRFGEAGIAFNSLDKITRSHELFFDEETFGFIREVLDKLHSTLIEKELALEDVDRRQGHKAWQTYENDFVPASIELTKLFRRSWRKRSSPEL